MESLWIISAYLLDLAFGDPPKFPHPVKMMGGLINYLEVKLNKGAGKAVLRIKGAILALAVTAAAFFISFYIIVIAAGANPHAGRAVWILLAYTCLAFKDLKVHADKIHKHLEAEDLSEAKKALSLIVGRDTDRLSGEAVVNAAVESISENTSDGVIAPLFYLLIGGPPLALAFKAVNTLDSMVGYRNEKYMDFGWFSARLDDAANYITARITGVLISLSSLISGKGFKPSFGIMLRDGRKHPSPNSGLPEAAMAGALGLKLGGNSSYGGKIVPKEHIGEGLSPAEPSKIKEAIEIAFISSSIMVLTGAALKWTI